MAINQLAQRVNLKYSIYEKINSISREIQSCISQVIKNSCTIYIGMQIDSLLDIYLAYNDIVILKNKRFYLQDEMILCLKSKEYTFPNLDQSFMNDTIKAFENYLGDFNLDLLINLVDVFFEKVLRKKITASDVKGAAERFIIIINALEKNGCKYKQIIEENYLEVISFIDNVFELKEMIH